MTAQDELLQRLEEITKMRTTTDRRMGNIWMLVPILPLILTVLLVTSFIQAIAPMIPNLSSLQESTSAGSFAGQLLEFYASAIVSMYAAFLLLSLAVYYLIDRRNRHFKRQQLLFTTLTKYLQAKASSTTPQASKLARICEDAAFDEDFRPAGLWATLTLFVTPVVSLVVAFNLTQDLCNHDLRQADFQESLAGTLTEAGIAPLPSVSLKPLKRDMILLLVLTVITAGLFWIYWFSILLKDYNEHFARQALFEDSILAALRASRRIAACAACGGSVPENAKYCPFCGGPQTS